MSASARRGAEGPKPAAAAGGRVAGRRLVDPARLSEAERAALADELYAVHRRIFAGVSADGFRRHVIEPPAETTVIQLYTGADGEVIGYCAMHRFRRRVLGRDAIVLRAEAGLLPAYRGRGVTYGFGILRALREKLRHPFTPVWYLGTLVHASSYHLLCKYFPLVWPRPGREAPGRMQQAARTLADSFPDPPVTPADPFIRRVGWITVESPQETALNRRGDRADVRFFKARNPGYAQGHGLVVVVPMSFRNIALAFLARLFERTLVALRRRHPEL